ncbi:MAG: nucleotide exchange factor GrpE [Flavobacteriales bacterium]|nr:nucleotide exchange factor GrpE [Flavobacteriales bacterium]MCB9165948.1 nucleotide exchange factor GrpE [Flavobacteriales bacterium]
MSERQGGEDRPQEIEQKETDAGDQNPLGPASEAASGHRVNDAEIGEEGELEALKAELDVQRTEHKALHDKYVRLFAEFDNFRKRTAKERIDLVQFAGENVLQNLLPVLDDMERAIRNNDGTDDVNVIKEGFHLVRNKLLHIMGAQGVRPMEDPKGQLFDTDRHEAVTKAPAPSPGMKGKVIDVIENGYTLNDRVLRYAKVVVGE